MCDSISIIVACVVCRNISTAVVCTFRPVIYTTQQLRNCFKTQLLDALLVAILRENKNLASSLDPSSAGEGIPDTPPRWRLA